MKYGPRKSAEIAAKALELRKAGGKWTDIAKQLRVSKGWLALWVNKAGYQRNDKSHLKASPANLLKARELRAQGLCWKLIGREMGISGDTLQRAINLENKAARDAEQ